MKRAASASGWFVALALVACGGEVGPAGGRSDGTRSTTSTSVSAGTTGSGTLTGPGGTKIHVASNYNSKSPYPLNFTCEDFYGEVFDDSGQFAKDFLDYLADLASKVG